MQHIVPPLSTRIQVPPKYRAARNVPRGKDGFATSQYLAPSEVSLHPVDLKFGKLSSAVLLFLLVYDLKLWRIWCFHNELATTI